MRTETVSGPPFRGQGEAIPADFGEGVWVIQDALYLVLNYATDEQGRPMVMPGALPNGRVPYAVPAKMVADKMEVPVDDLLTANREGRLNVRFQGGPNGDPSVVVWWFRIGERQPVSVVTGQRPVGGHG